MCKRGDCADRGLHAPCLLSMSPGKLRFRAQTLTATGCPSLSLRKRLIPYKSVVLSLPVPPCRLVSVSVEDSKSGGPISRVSLLPARRYLSQWPLRTTTPCLSLSVPVLLKVLNSDKSAVFVSPCPSLSPPVLERVGLRTEKVAGSSPAERAKESPANCGVLRLPFIRFPGRDRRLTAI